MVDLFKSHTKIVTVPCEYYYFKGLLRELNEIIQKKGRTLLNMLIAAKLIIVKNWKSDFILTVREWQVKCQYVLLIGKLTAIQRFRNGQQIYERQPQYRLATLA